MDGLKIDKWKENFEAGLATIKIEFDAFFLKKKLDEFYSLNTDETSHNLELEILHSNDLPEEMKDRITEAFLNARPEDSV
ncbi:MAG: hypothetical protein ACR2KZ_02565 [Segetibacter sp.]